MFNPDDRYSMCEDRPVFDEQDDYEDDNEREVVTEARRLFDNDEPDVEGRQVTLPDEWAENRRSGLDHDDFDGLVDASQG